MKNRSAIAFDTNYLVRHIVQDDAAQCRIVSESVVIESKENRSIRILDLVALETSWVLQSCYAFGREALVEVFEELLHDSAFRFDDPNEMRAALNFFRKGEADFADYLIFGAAKSHGCELRTFDQRLLAELS